MTGEYFVTIARTDDGAWMIRGPLGEDDFLPHTVDGIRAAVEGFFALMQRARRDRRRAATLTIKEHTLTKVLSGDFDVWTLAYKYVIEEQ